MSVLLHFLPAAVGWSLSVAMARAVDVPLDGAGLAAALCGIHAAYAFDRLVDRSAAPGAAPVLLVASTVAASSAVLALAVLDDRLRLPVLALALLAVCYAKLKRLIPKTVLTACAWTACVALLALSWPPPMPEGWAPVTALLLLVAANCILCDVPDIAHDRRAGIRGVAPWLGPARARRFAAATSGGAAVLALLGGSWPLAAAAAGLSATGLLRRAPERLTLDLILLAPGPLAWLGG